MDLLALIYLTWKIGNNAEQKGLSSLSWRFQNVAAWFVCYFVGVTFGIFVLNSRDYLGLSLLGLVSGIGGYLIIREKLKRTPGK